MEKENNICQRIYFLADILGIGNIDSSFYKTNRPNSYKTGLFFLGNKPSFLFSRSISFLSNI